MVISLLYCLIFFFLKDQAKAITITLKTEAWLHLLLIIIISPKDQPTRSLMSFERPLAVRSSAIKTIKWVQYAIIKVPKRLKARLRIQVDS